MKRVIAAVALCATGGVANADGELENFLIGPVIGLRLSGPPEHRGIVGIEGGAGVGPERLNIGFEHRSDTDFFYAEFDPWYVIGGTFGVGVDTNGKAAPVLGVWEGLPLSVGEDHCNDWNDVITVATGYRYTGVHELFVTLKAGRMYGSVCFD